MKVGVLALQGATDLHLAALSRIGAAGVAVRRPDQLADVDRLILPGGESTTMSMMLEAAGLTEPLAERLAAGMPVLGTCAGLLLLATGFLVHHSVVREKRSVLAPPTRRDTMREPL